MNFNKPSATAKSAVIRKTTVRIPITKTIPAGSVHAASASPPLAAARVRDPNRFKLSDRPGIKKTPTSAKPPKPVQRALAPSRGVKRKSATPQPALFSSDEEDASSDFGTSDSDVSRKRIKSSVSSVDSTQSTTRKLLLEKAFEQPRSLDIIHGEKNTSGIYESKYLNPWGEDDFDMAELQYPSRSRREKFQLKFPKNELEDYKPMEDIIETIKTICEFYLPDDLSAYHMSEDTGFDRRFNKAWQRQDIDEFLDIVRDFNHLIKRLLDDGSIQKHLLLPRHTMPLPWVRRILDQIYARTVSPKVESLRAYQNGSDNVYGELLPRFCSDIFRETSLSADSVFVDLGSGVGNVVLQAALEIGCESHGIEMMKNPCDLADLQAKEFSPRAQLWGLSVGAVRLLRGDFTDHPAIAAALKRADVVLVNNQAFTPALNDKLRDMFLDLKDGCRVVSLKPFVPEGHKIANRNIGSVVNLFVQRRLEYFSNSVSWTDQSGYYYIATKDPRPLEAFMRRANARGTAAGSR